MAKRITIGDIAEAAGVSAGTVSHVLNGNHQRVSEATRERVLRIMRELNYQPSAIAQSMARQRTATLGLIVSDIVSNSHIAGIRGIEAICNAAGYQMLLMSAATVEAEQAAIATMRAHQVAGCIFLLFSHSHPSPHISQLRREGMPLVVINRPLADRSVSQVRIDDHGAGKLATQHLLDLGHTRVATLAGVRTAELPSSASERHAGWEHALRERGITPRPEWIIEGHYDAARSYAALQAFMRKPWVESERPTALFAANFSMAAAALKALLDIGIAIPREMAVVGVDDPPHAAYTYPALTTLALPAAEAGRVAARMLLDWISTGQVPDAQQITLGMNLHVRESCGAQQNTFTLTPGHS